MSKSTVRIGFIGCGGIANQKHLPGMAQEKVNGAQLVAFCDLIEERAQKAAAEYGDPGAKVYTDYRELLADPTIDAVHVLTPNVSHCEISCAAMEAGKHVLCEKPMAATKEDAKRMLDTRDKTGKMLTIGYQYRHFHENAVSTRAGSATSTMPRLRLSAAAAFLRGACSPTSRSRAAVRLSTSPLTRSTSPSG